MPPLAPRPTYEEALQKAEQVDPSAPKFGLIFSSVADIFKAVLQPRLSDPDDDEFRRARWEYIAFKLIPRRRDHGQDSKYSLMSHIPFQAPTDGAPDPAFLPEEALVYFQQRLMQSTNVILRGRYAEILWDRRADAPSIPGAEKALAARVATEAYVELAARLRSQDRIRVNAVNILYPRAIDLSLELKCEELLGFVVSSIIDTAKAWLASGDTKHVSGLVDVLLNARRSREGRAVVTDAALRALVPDVYAHTQPRSTMEELVLARVLLHALSDIEMTLGDQLAANRYLDDEAQTWEAQAAMHPGMAASFRSHWYEQAAGLYRRAGNTAKKGEMMSRMLDADRESETRGEYKRIEVPVSIPLDEVRPIWSRYTTGADLPACLAAMASDDDLIPSRLSCEQQAECAHRRPTLMDLIPKAVYKDGRRVLQASAPDDRLKLGTNESMQYWSGCVVFWIVTPVLAILREKRGLNEDSLVAFLMARGHLPPESEALLRQGLHHYFQGQLVAAVYILVPNLERTIRDICSSANLDVTPPRDGGYRAKTLQAMLNMPEVKNLLGSRVHDYVTFALTGEAEGAMNLRNDVAHAFLQADRCTQSLADLAVHLTLILSRFAPQTGKAGADVQGLQPASDTA